MKEKKLECHGIYIDGKNTRREGAGSTDIIIKYNDNDTIPSDENLAAFIFCPFLIDFRNECSMPVGDKDALGNATNMQPQMSLCKYEFMRMRRAKGYLNSKNQTVSPEQLREEIIK